MEISVRTIVVRREYQDLDGQTDVVEIVEEDSVRVWTDDDDIFGEGVANIIARYIQGEGAVREGLTRWFSTHPWRTTVDYVMGSDHVTTWHIDNPEHFELVAAELDGIINDRFQ